MKFLAVVLSSCVLAACGGGGGSSAPTSNITITGTAATGLAIAGAAVTGKCKVGTGTATTQADGTFTLTVTNGQLPCVLQVTNPADGTKLHTLVSGTGNTAVANITPLTEMTTARALGSEPNVFFAAFDAAVDTQKVTTNSIATAQTAVGLVFTGTVDTTGIGNFITTPLVAATQSSPNSGDAQDKLLDALKLKLTSAQLGTVTTALASNQTTDTIKQTVINLTTAPSAPPVAKAGSAQSVVAGATVTLDSSTSSAASGKTLTHAWTFTSKPTGSAATLAAPSTVRPSFVADVAGEYVFSVIVNDGTTDSSAAAVTVTASVANAAPVANAGIAQNVVAGSLVTLDGSASSDANGDQLTYAWTLTSKPAGSSAGLTSATSAKPTFTADVAGTYVATLTVNDAKVNSIAVTVSITAAVANAAPVANAGVVQNVVAGSLVTLDGSASSDANSDPLTYSWTLTSKPAGSSAALSSLTSAKPTFMADVAGTYVGTLTVSDGTIGSVQATTTVVASSAKFSDKGDGTVIDNVTGLMWMRCQYGQNWDGSTCSGTSIRLAWIYASRLDGTVTFAGQSDWRLPNIRELSTLMQRLPNVSQAINGQVFPGNDVGVLWSSTPWPNLAGDASRVASYDGGISYTYSGGQLPVLLVRSTVSSTAFKPDTPTSDYVVGVGGIATHLPTKLMWKQCSEGQTWDGTTCTGNETVFTWNEAMKIRSTYAQFSNWRLPTAEELVTLASYPSNDTTSINVIIFPKTPHYWFWSSSVGQSSDISWMVGFHSLGGSVAQNPNSLSYLVRLVRSTD